MFNFVFGFHFGNGIIKAGLLNSTLETHGRKFLKKKSMWNFVLINFDNYYSKKIFIFWAQVLEEH